MRGWPLLSLGIVLGGWILVRVALWETPFPPPVQLSIGSATATQLPLAAPPSRGPKPHEAKPATEARDRGPIVLPPAREPLDRPSFQRANLLDRGIARDVAHRAGLMGAERIIAHSMLLVAAYREGGGSGSQAEYPDRAGPIAPGVVYAPESARDFTQPSPGRWAMDLWALWRDDTTTPLTSGRPSYGRSQVGAVLRYRLDPRSSHAPRLHLRATRAMAGARESDLAAGASARPIPSVPLRLAAEARVSETDSGTELRAGAYAVTELPPVDLPAGLRGDAYLQGGYVTGEHATPFVDGQARIARELAATDTFRLTAGGAAWGGAQEDAERLDIGPSAAISFRIGQTRGRLSADYRFRVAGDAEPSSGPALTLTAGF